MLEPLFDLMLEIGYALIDILNLPLNMMMPEGK